MMHVVSVPGVFKLDHLFEQSLSWKFSNFSTFILGSHSRRSKMGKGKSSNFKIE